MEVLIKWLIVVLVGALALVAPHLLADGALQSALSAAGLSLVALLAARAPRR